MYGVGCRVQGAGCRVQSAGCKVVGLEDLYEHGHDVLDRRARDNITSTMRGHAFDRKVDSTHDHLWQRHGFQTSVDGTIAVYPARVRVRVRVRG